MFAGVLDFVGRLVGLGIVYGTARAWLPPLVNWMLGRRELPVHLEKPQAHLIHIAALVIGWWLVSH